jgi:uncharacterized membrane protein
MDAIWHQVRQRHSVAIMDRAVGRHRAMLAVVAVLALAVVAGAALLWPEGRPAGSPAAGQQDGTRLVAATLTRVRTTPCEQADPAAPGSTCIKVQAELADGGRRVAFDTTDPTGQTFHVGQRVKLAVQEQEGQDPYYNILDLERTQPMLLLAALFVAAVLGFGRWQGIRSLVGLAVSFAVIIWFVVPAIMDGQSPVSVAVIGAMAIMLASLYLSHGVNRKTTAAVVGTALALGLTAALTVTFVEVTSLTGLGSEEALAASFQAGGLSLRGLLLAGIIIGGLGVLDDVTMSQASLVFELRRAAPAAGFGELVRGALAVGRDHIAATVNTLFLAYAGAALPLLVLFTTGGETFGEVATAETVAVEIVRTLCGSIGLIAAVPLTTLLAAVLAPQGDSAAGGADGPTTLASSGPSADRVPYSPARGLTSDQTQRVFDRVLALHQPQLSHAVVGVPGGSFGLEALPADARQAAVELKQLAAAARPNGESWYRRALAAGRLRLDLHDPHQLSLLRRFGPFSINTQVWVTDDPEPVIKSVEALDGEPRVTYRLEPDEFDRLRVALDEAGLAQATLVPRRSRAGTAH